MTDIRRSAIVPYTAKQMFDLVNDVERYPEFIPSCNQVELLHRDTDEVKARIHFARGGFEKAFTTLNRLQTDKMIEIRLVEGPFKHLEGFWRFDPLPNESCQVTLDLEFEFSNKLLAIAFGPLFTQVANLLVDAFTKRAEQVYGS
ncbi:MAG: type II toxin-antitoxin system RatA family toxin [Coxiellaceae bacterium]|nr:MAG: type II toxin-antitoxin system RatA family toxin [Coxiellaceae bacterium]